MKKIIVCILIITLIFSASGCKKFKQGSKSSETEKNMRVDKKESTVVVEKEIEEKEISTEKVEKSEILPKVESKENNSTNSRKETTTNQQKVVEKKVEVTQPKEQPKKVEQPVQQEQPKSEEPKQVEQPKVETPPSVSQKSDMEIAIEEQLKLGDPVTYYNGHPISISECHSLGGDLKDRRDTTLVNRYECVYTSYGNATAVGLIVQFTIDGQVYRKSYDEYKTMMN